MNTVNRGSEWNKWDLHYHVFGTHLNNQFGDDENSYLAEIENSDISAFGITDYWTASKQLEIIKKFKDKYPTSNKKFFVNVEFRLNQNVSSIPTGHVNVHLIFDNKLKPETIISFIDSLELTSTHSNGTKTRIAELENQSEYECASISLDEIMRNLKKHFGTDKPYLLGFAAGGLGGIRPYIKENEEGSKRNGVLSDEFDKKGDFFFANKQSRDYFLKENRYEHSKPKPCILASDYHGNNTQEQLANFTWIKSELTFDGLKQIKFEPSERVSLDKLKPDEKNGYHVIDHVKFTQKAKHKDYTNIVYFNPNLNAIIGGRSNGKSTLTNSIAKASGNERFNNINSENVNTNMHVFSNSNLEIYWQDTNEPLNSREIEFLPQDYMIKIAENNTLLNKLVKEVIKNNTENYTKVLRYDRDVNNIQSTISQLLTEYMELRNKLANQVVPEGDELGIRNELTQLRDKISKEENNIKKFSADDKKLYDETNKNISIKQENINLIEDNLSVLTRISSFKLKLTNELPLTKDFDFNSQLSSAIEEIKNEANLKIDSKIKKIISEQKYKKISLQQNISSLSKSESYRQAQNHISNNQTLTFLTQRYKEEENKYKKFNEYKTTKKNLIASMNRIEKEILAEDNKLKTFRKALEESFKVVSNDKIEITLEFRKIPFEDKIQYLNGRNSKNKEFIACFDKNPDAKSLDIFNDLQLKFNQGKQQIDLIKDIFSTQWFDFDYILHYENDRFSQMSQGKKAFVILSLILAFSDDKKPVIIDQPEDSLDNRAIYRDLTLYLKEKKKERQIIVITHNPNVVVGSDVENVIVANQHSETTPNKHDIQFDYINGALERSFTCSNSSFLHKQGIREHVIETLEGGNDAFKKREEKYNLEN